MDRFSHAGNSVAVFPGQGSQTMGMAKEFYEQYGFVREIFEEASESIRVDLKKLCFNGPESDLNLTQNTQPCLLTASFAAFRVAQRELGIVPNAVAGHSLGEYTALVAAGALKLSAAVSWVRERGLAMQQAVPVGEGSMAAIVGLDDSSVQKLCEKATAAARQKRPAATEKSPSVPALVEPVNYNAPGQVVIAGSADAVEEAVLMLKSDPAYSRGKGIPLAVSAPFHSQLMRPARDRMQELFSQSPPQNQPQRPSCPYIPNFTARLTQEPDLIFEFFVEQVDHPVLWKQSVEALLAAQFTNFIEFGPGKVLSGLIKRISAGVEKSVTLSNVSDLAGLKNLETLLTKTQSQVRSGA